MMHGEAFGSAVSAEAYDIQYPAKDYKAEAQWISGLIREHGLPDATSLLDVACGTGRHLEFLAYDFPDVAGVDASEAQLARAAARLPAETPLHVADMTDISLGRSFGAVICLFAAVAHLDTHEKLERGISAMAKHTGSGRCAGVGAVADPRGVRTDPK